MKYVENRVEDFKIAYIGGGSRLWAMNLMGDLSFEPLLSGQIDLYDVDYDSAKANETFGNNLPKPEGGKGFTYRAVEKLETALDGADMVIISIFPGTYEAMGSDVHHPEKYGIYTSVGDTVGPAGIFRALRFLPLFEQFALAIKEHCPNAWVVNFTNPMTVCTRMLYKAWPEIKAYGCCHEVFGTQSFLAHILEEECGIKGAQRDDIRVNVLGVNHFTWLTEAHYKNIDLFPIYKQYVDKHHATGKPVTAEEADEWARNPHSRTNQRVKMDLFRRYGYIAAAGDRHLAEFCPGDWYLKDPETVYDWGFALTNVPWRKSWFYERSEKRDAILAGKEKFDLKPSGEETVRQIKGLLGLGDLVTNVNMPNRGQIPNLPMGAVVETNASFTTGGVKPLVAGEVPQEIYGLISPVVWEQETVVEAAATRDLDLAFKAFVKNPLVRLPLDQARKLFDEMVENTKEFLGDYLK